MNFTNSLLDNVYYYGAHYDLYVNSLDGGQYSVCIKNNKQKNSLELYAY